MKKKIEKYFYDYNHTIVLRQHFQCDSQLIVPNILVTLFANSWQDNRNRVTPITAGPLLPPPFPLQEKTLGVCIPYSIFSYSSARLFASPSYWFGRITASWPNHQNFNKNLFQPATSWLTYRRSQTGLKTGPRLWASYSRWLLIFYPFLRVMFIKKLRARQALQRLPLG